MISNSYPDKASSSEWGDLLPVQDGVYNGKSLNDLEIQAQEKLSEASRAARQKKEAIRTARGLPAKEEEAEAKDEDYQDEAEGEGDNEGENADKKADENNADQANDDAEEGGALQPGEVPGPATHGFPTAPVEPDPDSLGDIFCNSCGVNPIVGIRYKCLE